jgi:hypothetical protein
MGILPWPDDAARRRQPQMPTVSGDVVITHPDATSNRYAVWRVMRDGEQTANPTAPVFWVIGGSVAMTRARLMLCESRGWAIYFVQLDTLTWTKLSD